MIVKLKRFFSIVWKSATDFSYYKDIIQAPFSFSLKYLFILLFFINLVGGIIFSINIAVQLPKIPSLIEKIKTAASEFYPDELVVTVNNGKIKTNVDEPYFIDFPKSLNIKNEKNITHFITIDTKAAVDNFKKYQTIILITKNTIMYPDSNSGYKIQPLDEIKGYFMFDKYAYNKIISKLFPYLNYLPIAIYVLIFISILIFPIIITSFDLFGKIFYVLIMSLFLWIVAKLMKTQMKFGKVIQLSLHGLTVPVVLSFISQRFSLTMPTFSFTLIFLLLMIVILSRFKERVLA